MYSTQHHCSIEGHATVRGEVFVLRWKVTAVNLVFGRLGRMWAGLVSVRNLPVDKSYIVRAGIGLSPGRGLGLDIGEFPCKYILLVYLNIEN